MSSMIRAALCALFVLAMSSPSEATGDREPPGVARAGKKEKCRGKDGLWIPKQVATCDDFFRCEGSSDGYCIAQTDALAPNCTSYQPNGLPAPGATCSPPVARPRCGAQEYFL